MYKIIYNYIYSRFSDSKRAFISQLQVDRIKRLVKQIHHIYSSIYLWKHNEKFWKYILIFLFLLVFIAGYYGYWSSCNETYTNNLFIQRHLDALYKTLQLFVLNGNISEILKGNIFLWIGAFLAPMFTFVAILVNYSKETRHFLAHARRPTHDHIILCGLGEIGFAFFETWRAARIKSCKSIPRLLIIDKDPDPLKTEQCVRCGVCVIHADVMQQQTMQLAHLHKAKRVVLLLSSDAENIEAAKRMYEYLGKESGSGLYPECSSQPVKLQPEMSSDPVEIWPHVKSSLLIEQLEQFMAYRDNRYATLRFFNIYDLTASQFLRQFPPDIFAALRNRDQVHLVFFGFGGMGREVAVEAAKQCHYLNRQKIKLTVFDAKAHQAQQEFLTAYPAITQCCEIEFHENAFSQDRFASKHLELLPEDATQYIITFGDDTRSVTFALSLREAVLTKRTGNVPIFVRVKSRQGCGSLFVHEIKLPSRHAPDCCKAVADFKRSLPDGIHPFGLLQDVLDFHAESVQREVRARLFHDLSYVSSAIRAHGKNSHDPVAKPVSWSDLSYFHRESNRLAADHIAIKLRAIRHVETVMPANTLHEGELPAFPRETPEESPTILYLAKMEKARWNAERLMTGWKYGSVRSDMAKVHDNILSWEEMDAHDELRKKLSYDIEMSADIPAIVSGRIIKKAKDNDKIAAVAGSVIKTIEKEYKDRNIVRSLCIVGIFAPDLHNPRGYIETLDKIKKTHPHSAFLLISVVSSHAERQIIQEALRKDPINTTLWAALPIPYTLYPELKQSNLAANTMAQEFYDLLGRAEQVFEIPFMAGTLADMAAKPAADERMTAACRTQFQYLASYLAHHCDELILGKSEGKHAVVPSELINQWWLKPESLPDEFAWKSTLHMTPPRLQNTDRNPAHFIDGDYFM